MTPIISSFSNSIVIQKYCDGKTLDKIAQETNLSKGTVYNLVKRWKDNLGNSGIDEIWEFSNIVSKSGMTILSVLDRQEWISYGPKGLNTDNGSMTLICTVSGYMK